MVVAALAGCAASRAHQGARAAPSSTALAPSATASEAVCAQQAAGQAAVPNSRWREMTWAEYYADVERNAWQRGARVIWIEPPRVSRVPKTQVATACPR